jgi:hypothetical protein
MDDAQIELLIKAAQHPFLTAAQRASLQLVNPYSQRGPVAEIMQSAVAELDPLQARAWRDEAGVTMSLQAAAAQRGLAPMTPELQAEIQRFNPLTADEARQQRIAELTASNPYGTPERHEEDANGNWTAIPGQPGNLTAAMELEALDPTLAAQLEAKARPGAAQPQHQFTQGDIAVLQRHGYAVPVHQEA